MILAIYLSISVIAVAIAYIWACYDYKKKESKYYSFDNYCDQQDIEILVGMCFVIWPAVIPCAILWILYKYGTKKIREYMNVDEE